MSCKNSPPNKKDPIKESHPLGPTNALERRQAAFRVRLEAALFQKDLPLPGHPSNGDEDLYPGKIGNYSKGLPHNKLGEVEINAYNALLQAITSGSPEDFELIPLGGIARLTNPQGAYAFELTGPDAQHLGISVPPAFSSAWIASEMGELYWQALARDIPFVEYPNNPLIQAASADLSAFTDFQGPKIGGKVTAGTLFRGTTPGDLIGPYIAQFLWKDIPFGATVLTQRYRVPLAGDDHLTEYEEWLAIQNGMAPTAFNKYDPTPRYIRNGRDLGEWVHKDFSYQCLLSTCLYLLSLGQGALDPANPYLLSNTQTGFITFGAPHILDLIARGTMVALKAGWFQKFSVHRRLRPEEFGGRIHNLFTRDMAYPINQELLNSKAISEVFTRNGTYLLPVAFPEGCPTHPAYPAGHACLVGAGATLMKAFFKEDFVIPNPVVASTDGLTLVQYSGPPLTIGGELNKLASNIALGRDTAGLHWRSDGSEGLKLGEAAAIGILQDFRRTYHEDFSGFSLTRFDGTTIIV